MLTKEQSADIGVRVAVAVFAIILGVLLSWLLIVPILKDNCVFFTRDCACIQYQKAGNELLVTDKNTGYAYWYDGQNTIYAYGDNLVGSCPTSISQDATGESVAVGDPVSNACREWSLDCSVVDENGECSGDPVCTGYYAEGICEKYDDTGACVEWGPQPPPDLKYTPELMGGEQLNNSNNGNLFIPVFAINATTMELYDGTLCTRPYYALPVDLLNAEKHSVSYKMPDSIFALDAYQMFDVLKARGIFTVPSTT